MKCSVHKQAPVRYMHLNTSCWHISDSLVELPLQFYTVAYHLKKCDIVIILLQLSTTLLYIFSQICQFVQTRNHFCHLCSVQFSPVKCKCNLPFVYSILKTIIVIIIYAYNSQDKEHSCLPTFVSLRLYAALCYNRVKEIFFVVISVLSSTLSQTVSMFSICISAACSFLAQILFNPTDALHWFDLSVCVNWPFGTSIYCAMLTLTGTCVYTYCNSQECVFA